MMKLFQAVCHIAGTVPESTGQMVTLHSDYVI
jgi:hypothetical protein